MHILYSYIELEYLNISYISMKKEDFIHKV